MGALAEVMVKTAGRRFRAGVDIGGTKVRIGLVDEAYEVAALSEKLPVKDFENASELFAAIAVEIQNQMDTVGGELIGVGLGCPGPLNAGHTKVMYTPNTPILQYVPAVAEMERHVKVPVKMSNDANVFVLGEAMGGAAKGREYVYGITLGTGYGHGFVWNGRILSGAHGVATEFGIAPYADSTFEEFVSGRGLVRHYEQVSGKRLEGPEIFDRAQQGEAEALAAWSMLGRYIAHSLVYVFHLLDPEIVVIGGSLAAGYDFFIDALRDELEPRILEGQRGEIHILPAALGDAAPIIGAAALIQPD